MIYPRTCMAVGLACLHAVPAIQGQPRQPPDPMKAITASFNSAHKNLLEMAELSPRGAACRRSSADGILSRHND